MITFTKTEGKESSQVLIAFFEGKPAGNAVFSITPPSIELQSLFVKPAFESKGIGLSLIGQVKDEAINRGLNTITGAFEPNGNPERCRRFYEKNGFKIDEYDNLICNL